MSPPSRLASASASSRPSLLSSRAGPSPLKSSSGATPGTGDRLACVLDTHAAGELSTPAALRSLTLLASDSPVVAGGRSLAAVAERLVRSFRRPGDACGTRDQRREHKDGKPQRDAPAAASAAGGDGHPEGENDAARVCVACAVSDLWIDRAQAFLRLLWTEANTQRGDMGLLLAATSAGAASGGAAGSRAAQRRRRKKDREQREAFSLAACARDAEDGEEREETGGGAERRLDGDSGLQEGAALVKDATALTQAIAARIRDEANREQFCLPTLTSLVRLLHRLALVPLLQPSSGLPPETLSPGGSVASSPLLVDLFPPLRRVLRDSVAAVLDVLGMKHGAGFSVSEEEDRLTLKTACAEMLHHVLHQPASLSLFSSSLASLTSCLRSSCFDLAFDENEDLAFYGRSTLCRLTWIFRRASSAPASLASSSPSSASTSPVAQDEKQDRLLSFEGVFEQTLIICDGLCGLCNAFLESAFDGSLTRGAVERRQSSGNPPRMQAHQGRQPPAAGAGRALPQAPQKVAEGKSAAEENDELEAAALSPDAAKRLRAKNDFQRATRAIQLLRDLLLFGGGQPVPKEGALGVSLAPFEREGGRFLVVNFSPCLDLLRAFLEGVLFAFHQKAAERLDKAGSTAREDSEEADSEAESAALSVSDQDAEEEENRGRKRGRDGPVASHGNYKQLGGRQDGHGDQRENGKKGSKWMNAKAKRRQRHLGASASGPGLQGREEGDATDDEDGTRAEPDAARSKNAGEVSLTNAGHGQEQSFALLQHLAEADVVGSPLLENIFTATIECMQALLDVAGDAGVMADVAGFASFAKTVLQASTIDVFPFLVAARFSGIIFSFLHSLFTTAPFLFPPLADIFVAWTASVFEALGAPLPLSSSASARPPSAEESSHSVAAFRKLRLVALCRAVYAVPFFQLGQLAGSRRGSCAPFGETAGGTQTRQRSRRALADADAGVLGFSGLDPEKRRKRRRGGNKEDGRARGAFIDQASAASLQDDQGLLLVLRVWQDSCRFLGMLLKLEASRSLRNELFLTRLRGAADGMCLDILLSGLMGPTDSLSLASPLADMIVSDTRSLTATLELLHTSLARGSVPPSQQTVEAASTLVGRLNRLIDSKRRSLWMGGSFAASLGSGAEADEERLSGLMAAIDGIRNCLSLRSVGTASCFPSLLSDNTGIGASQPPSPVWHAGQSRPALDGGRESSSFVGVYQETVRQRLILGAIQATEETYRQSLARRKAKEKASGPRDEPETRESDDSKESDGEPEAANENVERSRSVKEDGETPRARGEQMGHTPEDSPKEKERDGEEGKGRNALADEDEESGPGEEEHSSNVDEKASDSPGVSDAEEDEDSDSEELVSLIERIRQNEEDDFDGLQSGDDGDMDF
ncbi:conserved hypothetical protein [Neospora caninum Liverpool]|uniref:Uncharacterized protein n=1 Tax=Neospora caninum (strain Liverpool) TaxID=572307 RepID=F0VF48_NEOCL|nr:conserved hypothetical protein [Neospora caninum Liverpool]CBZ52342.1 conserved hypothetical protein [Neospora caninum Liverpool]CEL66311.1 TPA: hypothetical protein BN1204_021300 [Neospora caninum Liverpool]|eukprot:XP_003882374.1 conserved hypothetical protein [Neospora caninum Liverpool]